MGNKDKNPLKNVRFYSKQDYTKTLLKQEEDISIMFPEKNESTAIRLYVKDESKFATAKQAFMRFCEERLGNKPLFTREMCHS